MPPTKERLNIWSGFAFDNPAQKAFLRSSAKYRLLSSGRGGGKSVVGCRESIRCALEFPGSRNMIARLKSTELETSTHVTFKRELRAIGLQKDVHYTFNQNKNTYFWFNGSETVFSHLEDEEKFGSVELSTIFVDEGSQVPDSVYQMIFPANLRWEVGPHRAWFCTNPGASGWLRDIVYGNAKGSGREVRYTGASGSVEVVKDEYAWFPVKPGWNKHNPGGQDYFDDLKRQGERYGPHWLARYLDGNWDSFEGQRFPMFDHYRHVLGVPWKPEADHDIVMGIDFGHQVTHVVWIAYDRKGIEPVVVFDELEVLEVDRPEQVVNEIKRREHHYGISNRVVRLGDPAGVSSTQFSNVTVIGAYAALGVDINPCIAGKDPLARADMIASHLTAQKRQPDRSIWPGLLFGPNCNRTIHSIVNLRWDLSTNTKGEDPREKFLNKDKDGFDALGYGMVGVPPAEVAPPPRPRDPSLGIGAQTALREWLGG